MEIITIANYRDRYPADQYQDNLITTAINLSFDILNYKYSDNVIAERWEKTEETGGFTEAQKEHIRRAFLIQSRYYLQTGLRQATGSIQRTSGSVGLNISVPNRDEVQQGAILALEAAGITSLMSSQSGKVRGINECDEINLSKFATIDLVKSMCLQTQYTPSEGRDQKKNKIVKYNEDAIAEWVDLDSLIAINFLTKGEASVIYQKMQDGRLLTTDKTITGAINELFNTTPATIRWDTEPTAGHGEGYAVSSEGIKTYVDTKETNLQEQITANATAISTEIGHREDADTYLQSQITTNADNIELKQNITDNNLQTTSKEVVGAINELRTRILNIPRPIYQHTIFFRAGSGSFNFSVNFTNNSNSMYTYTGACQLLRDLNPIQSLSGTTGFSILQTFNNANNDLYYIAYVDTTDKANIKWYFKKIGNNNWLDVETELGAVTLITQTTIDITQYSAQ